jgi:hypothetical protein
LDLHWLHVQVAPPLALAGVRGSTLGDSHNLFTFRKESAVKHVIVGQSLADGKPGAPGW